MSANPAGGSGNLLMSFLPFINGLQNKSMEVRVGIFIGLMIFSVIVVLVIFGFSVKGVLGGLEFTELKSFEFVEGEINNKLPSIKGMIGASLLDLFRFREKTDKKAESIDNGEYLDNKGYKLPDAE